MRDLFIGTSAFTAAGWEGSFYPAGMKRADFLTFYATKFDSVEVDSTFYRTPSAATVNGWNRRHWVKRRRRRVPDAACDVADANKIALAESEGMRGRILPEGETRRLRRRRRGGVAG